MQIEFSFFYHPCYILLQPKAAILSTHCGADSGSLHHLITFYKLLKVVFYTLCMSWSYKSTLKNEWFYIPFCSPFFLNRGEYEFYIKNKWCIISFKMVCVGFIDFYKGLDWKRNVFCKEFFTQTYFLLHTKHF